MSGLINLPPLFPLAWPESTPRTPPGRRQWKSKYKRTYLQARTEAEDELRKFAAGGRFAITTDIPPRMQGEPDDPGVSAFWLPARATEPRAFAVDKYRTVRDNMCALAVTIEAFRAIERAGGAQILEVAMRSFEAKLLPANAPASTPETTWRAELGLAQLPGGLVAYLGPGGTMLQGRDAIEAAFRAQLFERHPDHGGTQDSFVALQRAREAGLKWLEGGRA